MGSNQGVNPSLGRRRLLALSLAAGAAALTGCTVDGRPEEAPSPTPDSTGGRTRRPTERPSPTTDPGTEEPADFDTIYRALGEESPQEWGVDVSGTVNRFDTREPEAVLTLDACGGPQGSGYDQRLIEGLRATATPATLFVNKRWAQSHPRVTGELVDDPLFEIANHGTEHLPLSVSGKAAYGVEGTASLRAAFEEIARTQEFFRTQYGLDLVHFRSGTAHVDEVAVRMAAKLNVKVVNFSLNADAGATYSQDQAYQALAGVQPGDICIGHFNQPTSAAGVGMLQALDAAEERGIKWTTLDQAMASASF